MNSNPTEKRSLLYSLLGDLPDRQRSISLLELSMEERDECFVERIVLDLNGIEPVPAYFLRPLHCEGPIPAILYNHSHGGDYALGKDEVFLGRNYMHEPPYGIELTKQGWAVLCIDTWAFGERHTRPESEIFKEMLWSGRVMWGMMVYDSLRALDYVCSRDDVDSDRIATLGMSMGSTMSWWVAALDTRIRACVDICCLTDFEALVTARGLDLHGLYYYVPGLLKHFTTSSINGLIAPRPHLSLAGIHDPLTPAEGLDRVERECAVAYETAGAPDAWRLSRYDTGHTETPAMRAEILEFLRHWL